MNSNLSRSILFNFYIIINVVFSIIFISVGYLGGDFSGRNIISNPYSIIIALIVFLVIMFFILKLIFPLLEKLMAPKNVLIYEHSRVLDYLFLLIAIYFLACSLLGVSNHRVEHTQLKLPSAFFYIYSLLSPAYLLLIYIFYNYKSSSKTYYSIIALTIVSSYLSGTSFILLYLLPLYIIKSRKRVNGRKLLLLIVSGIAIYPIFRFLKYALNSMFNLSSSFDFMELEQYINATFSETSYIDLYFNFLQLSLERFQIVSNISYIIDNSNYLYSLSKNQNILNVDFFIFRTIEDILSGGNSGSIIIQKIVAGSINGSQTWSSQISLAGFAIIEGLESVPIYLYMLVMLALSVFMSKFLSSDSQVLELTWLNTLLFICHGWVGPFTYYVYSLFVFIIIVSIFNFFKIMKSKY